MRTIIFLALVAACGGHNKSVGNGAPGGGAGSGSDEYQYDFSDPAHNKPKACKDVPGDPLGSCEPAAGSGSGDGQGAEACPPGYSRSGGSCVPTPAGIRKPVEVDVDGEANVVGAIPKDAIHRTVRGNFSDLRSCYEQVLLANPGVEGRVVVKFKVGIDGTVSDVTATGVHPDLESCIADRVRKLRFPKPDNAGSVEVTYPFVFKAG